MIRSFSPSVFKWCPVATLILALSVLSPGVWILPATASTEGADSTAVVVLDDGPHLYRQNDTSVIAFYLCGGEIVRRTMTVIDTLRFHGFCADSLKEYVITTVVPAVDSFSFEGVSRILAVSDIHGEYEHLVDILTAGGVIDDNGHWCWGDGHLVVVGDIFDRGNRVTECLWLIYRLQQEARHTGGRVHFILGNHELMVLRGDNRYVNDKYLKGIVRRSRISHQDLYGPDMELGWWLRSLPSIVRLNGIIFVHAGLSPAVMQRNLGLKDINTVIRDGLDLRSSQVAFSDTVKFLFGSQGPLWYRGYHYEMENRYAMATVSQLDSILGYYAAVAIVVGHTEVDSVLGLFDGRIIAVDVPVDELGGLQALLWENGRFYRVGPAGERQVMD
ncbi:MAG: metallophosphoesterase [bacterium]